MLISLTKQEVQEIIGNGEERITKRLQASIKATEKRHENQIGRLREGISQLTVLRDGLEGLKNE